jgi:hypothetical protein
MKIPSIQRRLKIILLNVCRLKAQALLKYVYFGIVYGTVIDKKTAA